jgi:hypothetical protein
MATTFKTLRRDDVVTTRSLLHEAIPITGSIVSGTYNDENIKTYSHGMFQSVYDYPYLSSSANHIFDLTTGYSSDSSISGTTARTQQDKKINLYNEVAQVLMGFDYTGSVQLFDEDGDLSAGGTKLKECVFVNFARLLTKDEIKKGSFTLQLGASASFGSSSVTEFNSLITIQDTDAANSFKVNSPAGEYGILLGTGSVMPADTKVGLIFYQAGIAVLSGSVFQTFGDDNGSSGSMAMSASNDFNSFLTGASIENMADAVRHRMYDLSFNNTTELNSTVYFCRASNKDFNYSSNPTYLTASKIRVKEGVTDPPVAYITTVGLYSPDNELLATAKLSEPLKKDLTRKKSS